MLYEVITGHGHEIRFHAKILNGKHLAGPAHTRLDFISNKNNTVVFTELCHLGQKVSRRGDKPAFTLSYNFV